MNPMVLEPTLLAHKNSVDDQLWSRVTARIRKDHEFQAHFGELEAEEQVKWSERILNETLGFLKLCSLGVGSFGPSELVDIGWHTFMLYSRGYMAYCDEVNGSYIHHEPNDVPGRQTVSNGPMSTVAAMEEHGIAIDMELWPSSMAGVNDPCSAKSCDSGPAQNCTCS